LKKLCSIKVHADGKTTEYPLRKGLRLDALEAKFSTGLEFSCRKGNCGICLFKVIEGEENLSPRQPQEEKFLSAMRADKEERLACQCRVFDDLTMEIETF